MDIYNRIDKILDDRKMSRRQLAIAAELPPTSLQSALARKKNFTIDMLKKIADALEIPMNDLLFERYETIAEVMAVIFSLDRSLDLIVDGVRDSGESDFLNRDRLVPDSITIKIDNERINEVLADWEKVRKDRLERRQLSYDKAVASLKKKPREMDTKDLLNVMNYDPLAGELQGIELGIIKAKLKEPLE